MIVSNFKLNPAIFVPGEEVTLSFTVKLENSDPSPRQGIFVYLIASSSNEIPVYIDYDFSISKGQSKNVFTQIKMLEDSGLTFARGTILNSFRIVSKTTAVQTIVTYPVTILDARYNPQILNFRVDRATSGALDDEGISVLTDMQVSASSLTNAKKMSLKVYYKAGSNATTSSPSIDLTSKISTIYAGVTDSTTLITTTFDNYSDWYFSVIYGDAYEKTAVFYTLPKSFANMHLSGAADGGVCFGGFSRSTEDNALLESYYPIHAYGGIPTVTDYSEDEVNTYGKWIDGRTIYRKTVAFTVDTKDKDIIYDYVLNQNFVSLSVVSITGTFNRTSDNKWFPINFHYSDTAYVNCQVVDEEGNYKYKVQVRAGWTGWAYVTVFYTKA